MAPYNSEAGELGSAEDLVREGYYALKELQTDHSLLKYLEDDDAGDEFIDRFFPQKDGHVYVTPGLANYYVALRDAAEEVRNINLGLDLNSERVNPKRVEQPLPHLPF